jgi:hypothetical protein
MLGSFLLLTLFNQDHFKYFYDDTCPSQMRIVKNVEYGIILFNSYSNIKIQNCYWLIEAPEKTQVYLEINSIEIPNDCSRNYLTISSFHRSSDAYKICPNRETIKLMATYNTVLITFSIQTYLQEKIGFELNFRIIRDTSKQSFYFICKVKKRPQKFSSNFKMNKLSKKLLL